MTFLCKNENNNVYLLCHIIKKLSTKLQHLFTCLACPLYQSCSSLTPFYKKRFKFFAEKPKVNLNRFQTLILITQQLIDTVMKYFFISSTLFGMLLLLSNCSSSSYISKAYQKANKHKYLQATALLEKLAAHPDKAQIIREDEVLYHLVLTSLAGQKNDTTTRISETKQAFFKYEFINDDEKNRLQALNIDKNVISQIMFAYYPAEKQAADILQKRDEQKQEMYDMLALHTAKSDTLMQENMNNKDLVVLRQQETLPSNVKLDFNTFGYYGEHLKVSFEYGQDSNAKKTSDPKSGFRLDMQGFNVGQYSSTSADNSLKIFTQIIEEFVAQDPENYSDITGNITGYADGLRIFGTGLLYQGEAGDIPTRYYYSENHHRLEIFEKRNGHYQIMNNEHLAFVRAFYAAQFLSRSSVIDIKKLDFQTHVSPKSGAEFRKVVIELNINNAFKKEVEELHEDVRKLLATYEN